MIAQVAEVVEVSSGGGFLFLLCRKTGLLRTSIMIVSRGLTRQRNLVEISP